MPTQQLLSCVSFNQPKTEQQQLVGSALREPIITKSVTNTSTSIINENNLFKNKNMFKNNAKNVNLPTALMEHFLNDETTSTTKCPSQQSLKFSPSLPHFKSDDDAFCQHNFFLKRRDFCSQFFNSAKTPQVALFNKSNENGPSRILDFMYLGSIDDATNTNILKKLNITKIINITERKMCPSGFINDSKHIFQIPVYDSNKAKLFPYFEEAYYFIETARKNKENILLHCMAGISRSATMAIAYIMRYKKIGCDEAKKFVKCHRPLISPNMNFMGQLMAYEMALRSSHILPPIMKHSYTCNTIPEELAKNQKIIEDPPQTSSELTQKTIENNIQRQRPTGFNGVSARNKFLSKSISSDTLDDSNNSFFSPSFTSLINQCSYLNENGKRKIEKQLALPQRPRQLFRPLLRTTSCSSASSDVSSVSTLDKNELFLLPMQTINEKIISPSTEFSKLDISFINPCFDSNNKTQLKSKQVSTSKTTCSEILFKDSKIDSQSINDIDKIELPPCTSLYSDNLIKPISENPMFENPIFNLSSKNLYPKLEKTDTIDLKQKNIEKWAAHSEDNTKKHSLNIENQKHSSFSSCKSLMRNIIRKNHQTSQSPDSLINEVNKNKLKDDKKLNKSCYFDHCKKINDNVCCRN